MLVSILHWFPLGINVLELASSFAHVTLLLSVLCTIIAAIFRLWLIVGGSLFAAGICACLVFPKALVFNSDSVPSFEIGQFNVYHGNPTPETAISEIQHQNVDILTIQELNSNWGSIVDSLLGTVYPYSIEAPWDSCCYGIGLYSKYPILDYEVIDLESAPVIVAKLDVEGFPIVLYSLHTRPPAFPNQTSERNRQLKAVADMAGSESLNTIVLGDFNVVPWDGVFKSFLEDGNLNPVRDGFQATYPMYLGFPLIPIDHITYSGNLVPTSCETVAISGSDHMGLVAKFAFKD